MLYLFLLDQHPLHARVQVPVPLVPVGTLCLFCCLMDHRFLEDLNQALTYHKLISLFQMPQHPMPTVRRNRAARACAQGTRH